MITTTSSTSSNAAIAVSGISLQANTTTATVSNNRLYQTAPRVFTAAVNYAGIVCAIGTGAGTATITGNTVGFGAANGTGITTLSGNAQTVTAMNLSSASTVTPTSVQNNTVSGISQSTASTGEAADRPSVVYSFGGGPMDVGDHVRQQDREPDRVDQRSRSQ